jgi:AcrR family transcriptional regulator
MHQHDERMSRRSDRHVARRRLKPEVRRGELVEAALAVLSSHDPDEVRVEDVTQAAGAAKGTFYLYFSSWSELLAAVRDHVIATYATQVLDRFASAGSASQWWAALENECACFIDFHIELGSLHRAVFHGPGAEHPVAAEHSADRVISRLLRQGMALGACRPLDVDIAVSLVFSLLHATADGVSETGDREEHLEALLTLLRAWLRMPGTDANC